MERMMRWRFWLAAGAIALLTGCPELADLANLPDTGASSSRVGQAAQASSTASADGGSSDGFRHPARGDASLHTTPTPRPGTRAAAGQPHDSENDETLRLINATRALIGLGPVTLDADLSLSAKNHAEYVKLNRGNPALDGLKIHTEDPSLPGYTAQGARKDIYQDIGYDGPINAYTTEIAILYHRLAYIDPQTVRVGLGTSEGDGGCSVTDFSVNPDLPYPSEPIAYPVDGQTGVPLAFGSEYPNPIPDTSAPYEAGYAITLTFPRNVTAHDVSATLTDAQGQDVPFYLSSPDEPASFDPQPTAICLIPKHHLQSATRYVVTVHATATGYGAAAWRWQFTTQAPLDLDALDTDKAAQHTGELVRMQGDVYATLTSSDGTRFFDLMTTDTSAHPMQIRMTAGVWKLYEAQGVTADDVVDHRVEVEATLGLLDKFVDLPVRDGDQLRVLPGEGATVETTDAAAVAENLHRLAHWQGALSKASTDVTRYGGQLGTYNGLPLLVFFASTDVCSSFLSANGLTQMADLNGRQLDFHGFLRLDGQQYDLDVNAASALKVL